MENNTWIQVVFGLTTIYFGALTIRIMPPFFRLLSALFTRVVKWPGPRIHDPDPNASIVRMRLGIGYQNLFPTFLGNASGVIGAFFLSLLTFLGSTPLLNDFISFKSGWAILLLSMVAFIGARMASIKAQANSFQINALLSNLHGKEEPRTIDGESAEAIYAIEHPLIGSKVVKDNRDRALDVFYEATRCFQEGNIGKVSILYQESLVIDPSLHENAIENLTNMIPECSTEKAGSAYYWLGIHNEYLHRYVTAAEWYEKAIQVFNQLGYKNRESRAHCNLGNVKMQMRDPSGMDEFEKAIALNPRNGFAHLNIARLYYRISEDGDEQFERALNAFADAIIADPLMYGPMVVSSLQDIGYTWKEDLEKITRIVENKQH